jgi:hypothetical protein
MRALALACALWLPGAAWAGDPTAAPAVERGASLTPDAVAAADSDEAFHFPQPVLEPKAPSPSLFKRSSHGRRAVRLLVEIATGAALATFDYVALLQAYQTRPEGPSAGLLLATATAPFLAVGGISLVGRVMQGRGNFGAAFLGGAVGYVAAFALNLAGLGPLGMAVGVMLSAVGYELHSYFNEIEEERTTELTLLEAPREPQINLLPRGERYERPPRSLGWKRALTGFGVATVTSGALALGTHVAITQTFRCGDVCQFNPTGSKLWNTMPIIAAPLMVILVPLLVNLWGQWWGGHGGLLFGYLGAVIGGLVAFAAGWNAPVYGNLFWLTVPAGATLAWELNSLAHERRREAFADGATGPPLSPAPAGGP